MDLPVIGAIGDLFKGIFGMVDDLHTSDEEKLILKGQMFAAQGQLLAHVLSYEQKILESQTSVVLAEATGESWLQRNWRPLCMLFMMGLVGAYWFGWTPVNLSEAAVEGLFMLVQIGLGGYVVGRSAEKVAKSINFKSAISTKEE